MRFLLLLLAIPFLILAEMVEQADLPQPFSTAPLPLAPLMPLEPQFPLTLTQTNEQLLIENPQRMDMEKKIIKSYLEKHSFPWLTIVVLLVCGGIGWTVYLTRDRWSVRPAKSVTTLSPKQQLDQTLQFLENRRLLENDHLQTLYNELASLLLDALQLRFGLKAKELTTEEIKREFVKSSQLSSPQKQTILSFLAEIDDVKFAGKKPSQAEAKQFYQHIQNFIQQL